MSDTKIQVGYLRGKNGTLCPDDGEYEFFKPDDAPEEKEGYTIYPLYIDPPLADFSNTLLYSHSELMKNKSTGGRGIGAVQISDSDLFYLGYVNKVKPHD